MSKVSRRKQNTRGKVAPTAVLDAIHRAGRVLDFCRRNVLNLQARDRDYCHHAVQALLHVMRDQLEAALLYAEKRPHRCAPIIVSVRPIYEAMLGLRYLLRPETDEERQALGYMFWAFESWETMEAIRNAPAGLEAYEESVASEERPNHLRRLEIADEIKTQFTPDQRRQLKRGRWKVTWTGKSIAQLARELEGELDHKFHDPWYGVMSMTTHGSPAMIHWSYKLSGTEKEHDQHLALCKEHSARWLDRGSGTMLSCALVFLKKYDIDLPDEATELCHEFSRPLGDADARNTADEALRSDPVIRDLVERIVNAVQPRRIILLGSAALDEFGQNSDFDVLVVLPSGSALGPAEDCMYRKMSGFPIPTDLIAVTEEDVRDDAADSNPLIKTALATGKEIYRVAG